MITNCFRKKVTIAVVSISAVLGSACASKPKQMTADRKEVQAPVKVLPVAATGPSAEMRYSIGRQAAQEVTTRFAPVADAELNQYVNRVGQYVALHMDRSERAKCAAGRVKQDPAQGFRIGIVTNPQPVAFSLPGGFVFVSSGLVEQVKSEDQLAGVLAHEMMHVICGDNLPTATIPAATGADTVADAEKVDNWVDQVMTKPYTRSELVYADRAAVVAMYRAGYYPNHYLRYVYENQTDPTGKHIAGRERSSAMKKDISKIASKIEKTVNARRSRYETFRSGVMSASAGTPLNVENRDEATAAKKSAPTTTTSPTSGPTSGQRF